MRVTVDTTAGGYRLGVYGLASDGTDVVRDSDGRWHDPDCERVGDADGECHCWPEVGRRREVTDRKSVV